MKVDIKSKLLFLTLVPSLVIVLLSINKIMDEFEHKKDLEQARQYIFEVKTVSNIVHFMQLERVVSTKFIAENKKDENLSLLKAREASDKILENLELVHSLKKDIDSKFLDTIKIARSLVDTFYLSSAEVRNYYTHQIETLLDSMRAIPTMMEERKDRNYMHAYSYLSLAKENLGQMRAILQETSISNSLSEENFIHMQRTLYIYNTSINRFKQSLQEYPLYTDLYKKTIQELYFKDTFATINSVLSHLQIPANNQ